MVASLLAAAAVFSTRSLRLPPASPERCQAETAAKSFNGSFVVGSLISRRGLFLHLAEGG